MKTAVEAHREIEAAAVPRQEVRLIRSMSPGQVVRQGDIYIHRVADSHAHGPMAATRQLALGETMGSRHLALAPSKVYVGTKPPEWCQASTFLGPLIVSKDRFVVGHPEHAHISLPGGRYQITHQMNAITMQRVVD